MKKIGFLCFSLLVVSGALLFASPAAKATPAYRNTPSLTGVNRRDLLPGSIPDLPNQGKGLSAALDQKIQSIVAATIRPGMTNYEKALTLHDWLVLNTRYDLFKNSRLRHEAEGVLFNGLGVCDGYAKAYMLLCDAVNVPCKFIVGRAGGSHAWNQIELDGNWYHVDCTWDDPVYKSNDGLVSGYENRDYFGLTDSAIRFDHAKWTSGVRCASIDYNFAYREGHYDALIVGSTREILLQLSQGILTFRLKTPPRSYSHADREIIAHALRLQRYPLRGEAIELLIAYNANQHIYTVKPKSSIPVSRIGLSANVKSVKAGQTLALAASINPANATDQRLTWKSSNGKLATIDESGLLTAKRAGKVTVTATAADGSKVKASIKITIKK